jgi:hypothetical protein
MDSILELNPPHSTLTVIPTVTPTETEMVHDEEVDLSLMVTPLSNRVRDQYLPVEVGTNRGSQMPMNSQLWVECLEIPLPKRRVFLHSPKPQLRSYPPLPPQSPRLSSLNLRMYVPLSISVLKLTEKEVTMDDESDSDAVIITMNKPASTPTTTEKAPAQETPVEKKVEEKKEVTPSAPAPSVSKPSTISFASVASAIKEISNSTSTSSGNSIESTPVALKA